MMQALVKGIAEYREIIHKNFEKFFYHVRKETKHATLERCINQRAFVYMQTFQMDK